MQSIKSYTDLSQSKKLAEILPFESADNYWMHGKLDNVKQLPTPNIIGNDHDEPLWDDFDVPCWSLAALLCVIPGVLIDKLINNKWGASSWDEEGFEPACYVEDYDNPVDACYELILKLHELKML